MLNYRFISYYKVFFNIFNNINLIISFSFLLKMNFTFIFKKIKSICK